MNWTAHLRRRLMPRTRYRRSALGRLGLAGWLRWRRLTAGNNVLAPGTLFPLTTPAARHPLLARSGTTDAAVFRQIFIEREYECLDDIAEPALILDCGANVGYSSAYFLSRFPHARVIAVEPDPGNFALLTRNLAPYGGRAELIQSAVWSHRTWLQLSPETAGPGQEWGRTVRECEENEAGAMLATDIDALLAGSGQERVGLLKMDIEGSEAVVFTGNCDWLDRVDLIAAELHGPPWFPDGRTPFEAVVPGRGFSVSQVGELTICRRRAGRSIGK